MSRPWGVDHMTGRYPRVAPHAPERNVGVSFVKLFSPPTFEERVTDGHPLWRRTSITRSYTVLKEQDGLYKQLVEPAAERIDAALIAFLGGRLYLVEEPVAAELVAAGYGQWLKIPGGTVRTGYGSGRYGVGKYGVIEVPAGDGEADDDDAYGEGPYGDGFYGE